MGACGVCHTDLTYREGGVSDEFPFLLGHEAAGTVESVGEDVDSVRPGDFVVLNWRAVCGRCRACRRGRAQYLRGARSIGYRPKRHSIISKTWTGYSIKENRNDYKSYTRSLAWS